MKNFTDSRGMTPLVSIVIPCFNAEKWIGPAIQSALEQTWPNKEIIVIDDGSSDGSLSVIKGFDGKVMWESGPNKGGCAARNRGIELAGGHWIQFLDADDVLLPDCVASKLTATTHAPNERICCNLAVLDGNGTTSFPEKFWNADRYDLNYMIRFGSPQTAAPLHRREELLKVQGFRAGLPCGQEFDLHLRLAIQLGITFVSHGKTGVLIRKRKGSVSDIPQSEWPLVKGSIILEAVKLLNDAKFGQDCRDAVAQRLMSLARQVYATGRPKEAARFATEAKRLSSRYYKGAYRSWPATLAVRTIGFTAFEELHALYLAIRNNNGARPV